MGRLAEIAARMLEIRTAINGEGEVDLTALETEIRELTEEKTAIEKRTAMAEKLNADPSLGEQRSKLESQKQPKIDANGEERKISKAYEIREQRGQGLKDIINRKYEGESIKLRMLDLGESDEERAETVGSSTVVLPSAFSSTIKDTFNQVSMLVDMVSVIPLMGGESYEKPWVNTYGEGAETTIDADSTDVETVFDRSVIGKSLVTAYQEWPRQITKLANAPYEAFVSRGIMVALRKRLTKQILLGSGATNNFTGIFSNGASMTTLEAANDLEIAAIDNATLETIIFNYGGDEEVEDTATLILNKKTLQAFSAIRTTDGFPFYKIVLNGATGTLATAHDSITVPFVINSNCVAIGTATAGQYVMAYGALSNYEMAIFSDAEILRSEDYKFKNRQIAYNGEVFAGGNVVAKDGFYRVKRSA